MSRIFSPQLQGLHSSPFTFETSSASQLPHWSVFGARLQGGDSATDRILQAIRSSGGRVPVRGYYSQAISAEGGPVQISLQAGMELPLAISLHEHLRTLSGESTVDETWVAWGAIAVSGTILPVPGLFHCIAAIRHVRAQRFIFPASLAIAAEDLATLRRLGVALCPVGTLEEAFRTRCERRGETPLAWAPHLMNGLSSSLHERLSDSSLPKTSRSHAGLAALAAAGGHSLGLIGPKGRGKTSALRWSVGLEPTIAPERAEDRRLLGELSGRFDLPSRHRESGYQPRPSALTGTVVRGQVTLGEFSLAHGGTLLSDEFSEWPRDSQEALRTPLETGEVWITRAGMRDGSTRLPAQFRWLFSGNGCACGRETEACRCDRKKIYSYQRVAYGATADRVDLVLGAPGRTPADGAIDRTDLEPLRSAVRNWGSMLKQRWERLPGELSATALDHCFTGPREQIRAVLLRSCTASSQEVSYRFDVKALRLYLTIEAAFPNQAYRERCRMVRALLRSDWDLLAQPLQDLTNQAVRANRTECPSDVSR